MGKPRLRELNTSAAHLWKMPMLTAWRSHAGRLKKLLRLFEGRCDRIPIRTHTIEHPALTTQPGWVSEMLLKTATPPGPGEGVGAPGNVARKGELALWCQAEGPICRGSMGREGGTRWREGSAGEER